MELYQVCKAGVGNNSLLYNVHTEHTRIDRVTQPMGAGWLNFFNLEDIASREP